MRRTELEEGVQQILHAIEESQIKEILAKAMDTAGSRSRSEGKSTQELLSALREYSLLAQNYNSSAKELAKIFELTILEDPSVWAGLIEDEGRPLTYRVFSACRFATDFLPRVQNMVKPKLLREIEDSKARGDSQYKDKSTLSVVVIEDNDRLSTPARLSNVLESVQLLYEACALLEDVPPQGLSVIGCDSGSDKSFDFLGAAKVMECLKEVILSLWDRVVFFRELQFSERIDLIAKSLPVVDRIGELEQGKRIGPEQAELLRRNIFDGIHKFAESGAVIPEIEQRSQYNVRLLMSPVQRLLVGDTSDQPDEGIDEGANLEQSDLNALNDQEREELLRLLKKSKRAESKSSEEPEDLQSEDKSKEP